MPSRTKSGTEEFLENIHDNIASIFQGSQTSNASHKRRINHLCKLQADAASHVQHRDGTRGKPATVVLTGEKAFNRAFWEIITRLLEVKRGVIEADRVVRFLGGFIGALMKDQGDENEDEEEQSPRERFVSKLISHLIPGCRAKDRSARFRCTQILSEVLRNVPSLDDDLYSSVKEILLERGTDKEWTIRSAASAGLGVLARGEGESEDSDDGSHSNLKLTNILEALCKYDIHPHVRLSCLPGHALPLNVSTLPLLISRTRDVDTSVRRAAFRLLQKVPVRGLSVGQRSTIIRNGLGDREGAVRAASSALVYQWALACSNYSETGASKRDAARKMDVKIDLDEFIDLFDLWDGEVAEEALKALIYKHPNVLEGLDMSQHEYWADFSPSKAMLSRVFTELVTAPTPSTNPYGPSNSTLGGNSTSARSMNASAFANTTSIQAAPVDLSKHLESLPVLTLQAFSIQGLFGILAESVAALQNVNNGFPDVPGASKDELEEQVEDCIFSLGQLLRMTISLVDGMEGDEVGRRTIKALARDMLLHPAFPSTLMSPTLSLLLKVSDHSFSFIDTVIKPILEDVKREERRRNRAISRRYTLNVHLKAKEAGSDDEPSIREEEDDDEVDLDEEEPSPEERLETTYLRLSILDEVLQLVNWPSSYNKMLQQLQKLLVRPALEDYKPHPAISDENRSLAFDTALKCHGLTAIHLQDLAVDALEVALKYMRPKIPPIHVVRAVECMMDIIMCHSELTTATFGEIVGNAPKELFEKPFLLVILTLLLQFDNAAVRATTIIGTCKLFLCGLWFSEEMLRVLVILYFQPDDASNDTLRQCLSYFLNAYCYSSPSNQARFSTIVTDSMVQLCEAYSTVTKGSTEEEDSGWIPPDRIVTMLLDYTDPSHLVNTLTKEDQSTHLHETLAVEIMERLLSLIDDQQEEAAAACIVPLCQGLNRLQLTANITPESIQSLLDLVSDILTNHTPEDKTAFKQLTSFEGKLRKLKMKRRDTAAGSSEEDTSKGLKAADAGDKRKRSVSSGSDDGSKRRPAKRRDATVGKVLKSRRGGIPGGKEAHLAQKGKGKARLRSTLEGSNSSANEGTRARKKRKSSVSATVPESSVSSEDDRA